MTTVQLTTQQSSRLGIHATLEQEPVLRQTAKVVQKPLNDFILDSACQAAEATILNQRLFMVSGSQYQSFLDLLDSPAQNNEGLDKLFSKPAPWDVK
jgi:uncharacterized protein (DUF1778 family)